MRIYTTSKLAELKTQAQANGWTMSERGNLTRITMRTRNIALRALWPLETYPVIETLTFTGGSAFVPPHIIHAVADAPWKLRRMTRVTFRKAQFLAEEPIEESPVHQYQV